MSKQDGKRPGEAWERYSHAAGVGIFARPIRFLVLLNGDMIALMEELGGGSWCVFATEHANGKITKSPVYRMRSVAEVIFREIADEVTERDKDTLAAKATAIPYEQATPEQKREIADASLEYMRLKLADEDTFAGVRAIAEKYCGTETEDVEAYVKEHVDYYIRERAQEEAE